MTNTMRSAPLGTDRPGAPTRRGRRVLLVVVLLLGLAAAAVLAWAGLGTVKASSVVQERAGAAQAELARFRGALLAGDAGAARTHLAAGDDALAQAQAAADRPQVRVAGYVPWVGRTVRDLDHLLAAANTLSGAGGDALTVYTQFSGADSTLFRGNVFSVAAIRQASTSVDSLVAALDSAEADLNQVRGEGPRGEQALVKKDAAFVQVTSLREQVSGLAPLLRALPAAVGADTPRTYLVTVLNPAESRASGGAPLSVAFVHLDQGRMTIPVQGQTSVLTNGNQPHVYTPAEGDPWLQGRAPRKFVSANVNPDFTVAGEQLLRASSSLRQRPDGVIALDVQAIAELLRATGPIPSTEYGELNAGNVARKLVVDAYLAPQDQAARHDRNDQLMSVMLRRLTDGGGLVTKARALGAAVPGRHLQMYFRDPALQKVVLGAGAGGAVPVQASGDLAAVYTQNINQSKVDTYQHRAVTETITLAADGSANVRRVVKIENRTPPYAGGGTDPRLGYYTRWVTLLVMNLMPPGAEVTGVPTDRNSPGFVVGSAQHKGRDGQGRTFTDALAQVEPGGTASLEWTYRLAKAAVPDGDGLSLVVRADTQPLLNPPSLRVDVVAPEGFRAVPGPGWSATGTGAGTAVTMDRTRTLRLALVPTG